MGAGGSYKRSGARRPVMKCWDAEPIRGLTGVLAHFRYKFARWVMGILRLGGGGSYKRIGARRPVMKCWDAEPIRGLTEVLAHFRYKFARRAMRACVGRTGQFVGLVSFVVLFAFVDPGPFHQGGSQCDFDLVVVARGWAHRAEFFGVVADLVLMFCNRNDHSRIATLAGHAISVDFRPVSALEVFDKPVTLLKGHAAVLT